MAREQDFISIVRQHNRALWDAMREMISLQAEWKALDYVNTLPPGEGDNEGITAVELSAVLFDTMAAFQAILQEGHGTNLAKLL